MDEMPPKEAFELGCAIFTQKGILIEMQKGREGGREDRRALYRGGGGGTGQVAKSQESPDNRGAHRRARDAAQRAARRVERGGRAGCSVP